jgi:sterol desaturase/sphingolipid hydroxylase (fatty acid hydroxylase superfamily)
VEEFARAVQSLAGDFLERTPARLWLALLLIGLAIEVFIKAERGQSLRDVLFNVRYATIYLGVIFVLSPSINVLVAAAAKPLGVGWIDLDVFSTGTLSGQVGAAIVFVIILDFFYYWWHRAQHVVNWLWDQHSVHHSDTALNVSTNMRHHWSEFIFQGFMIGFPMMVLFKLTPLNMWIISTVVSAWTWFIHMNIRLHLGPLSWIIVGPQTHRIHHSILPEHGDKNFAAYTPIWDVLFGTYHAPAPHEYPATGIQGVRIDTAFEASIYPFKRWIAKFARLTF